MGESSASILPYILPVLTDRLAQQEILEPAEEIRLVLVQILVTLVTQCQEKFAPFVDDAVKILAKTLADPYQEVRKTSCQMVIQLAKANSRPLAFHGAAVPKSILPCLVHRHSSVRIAGILVRV